MNRSGTILFFIPVLLICLLIGSCGDLLSSPPYAADESPPTMEQKLRGIWVVGGAANLNGSGIYAQLDLYDPVTDTWYADVAAGASGTYVPTVYNSVASVNGKLYVLGGAVSGPAVTSSVFEYNISTNSWRTMAGIGGGAGTPLMGAAVYTHANNIYLIGGTSSTTTAGVQTTHYRFDPASGSTGQWYALAAYTTARASMGAGYFDGNACFFGGRIAGGGGSTTNDIYVIATNNYTGAAEPVIVSRAGAAYATNSSVNGKYAFIVGGANTYTAATSYFGVTNMTYVAQASSFQIYTPPASAGSPTAGRSHPAFGASTATGLVFASAAVSPYNGSAAYDPTLYVFGGIQDISVVTNTVYAMDADEPIGSYAPTGLSWVSKASMPVARYGFGATRVSQ